MVITKEHVKNALSFEEYAQLIKDQANNGKTSGNDNQNDHIAFTKLNQKRMDRWLKVLEVDEDTKVVLKRLKFRQIWIVINETWCGDAAHSLPVMAKLAEINRNIDLRILFRDENPEIMEAYLTNGNRAIPRLIVLTPHLEELFNWGPKPEPLRALFQTWKSQGIAKDLIAVEVQKWYNEDKGLNTMKELGDLIASTLKA